VSAKRTVAIVDYGLGNLFNVKRAIEHVGGLGLITADPDALRSADQLLLPGVGAFGKGMLSLSASGTVGAIREEVTRGKQLLGICLGMQFLFDTSEEFGLHSGLGFVPGTVSQIPSLAADAQQQVPIPHIGWAPLLGDTDEPGQASPLLRDMRWGETVYFVHSYRALVTNPRFVSAYTTYGGHAITAVVQNDNIHGCQFHPEKSAQTGLRILENFLRI
jgi:glutamine amidotransferase